MLPKEFKNQRHFRQSIMESFIFFLALMSLESGFDPNAIGDNGKAVGLLQMHEVFVKDVSRISKTPYSWPEDCSDIGKCSEMYQIYVSHYTDGSQEMIARCWNGGPNGYKKSSTDKYWEKVQVLAMNKDFLLLKYSKLLEAQK